MRVVRLELRAFGSFTGAPPIEFDARGRGLHLILGPNEAGKSTALRAIRRLLFGFPPQAGDNHRHKYEDLRVAASLGDEVGATFEFLRCKKKRLEDSLRTLDDSGRIDPGSLARFLGGLDQERFLDLFSMDHDELIRGGQAILKGGGRIGEMLFAAGSGLAGIDEARKRLDSEADALFKPTGKILVINAALADLEKARSEAKGEMLATQDWVDLDARIARLKRELAENEAEWRQLQATKTRRGTIAKALPILRHRDDEAARLALRRDVPVLADGFSDLRRKAATDREMAVRAAAAATSSLETIARDLDELGPPDDVLGEADAILQIQAGLGAYQKARGDRPGLRSRLARVEADARALLAEFLHGRSLDQLGEARVLGSRRRLIQELAQQAGLLEAACAQAERDVEGLAATLPGPANEPPVADAGRLAEVLSEVIGRVAEAGKPEGRLADAKADRVEAERQADVDLRALRLWSGSLDELEKLKVPSARTINDFDDDFRAADEAIFQAEADRSRALADRLALEREIEAVRLAGPVPSEAELEARRADRDQAWRRVRAAWLGEAAPIAPPRELADRLEADMRAADDLADRLRREADRVADQSRREVNRLALIDRFDSLGEVLTRAIADRTRVLDDWQRLWRPLGVEPLPPRELRDWVATERPALLARAKELRKLRIKEEKAAETVAGFRSELDRGLAGLGEPPADRAESLAGLLARAKRAVARVDRARNLDQARSRRSKALADRDAWRAKWLAAVGPLGLDEDASPARATARLDGVDRAVKAMEEHAGLVEACAEADRVEGDWEAEVRAVLGRLQVEPLEAGAEDLARGLMTRLDEAREARTRREGLLAREAVERARLDKANADASLAAVTLEGLAREARCASIDDLEEAERASEEVKEARKQLQMLDERLSDLAGSIPMSSFLEEARAADAGAIEAEVAALADRLAPLDERRAELSEEIGGCNERLKRMDGGPAAADAQQRVEERAARLALDVEKYAKLRLASAILREAVERHRKEHQGPILDRAGALFAGLTRGSFAGLRDELDEKGGPVLLGVRGDGTTTLGVDAMSEGTADQLYLALRMASLHAHLDTHEPMPLVLDDVLVNFDDARAAAALKALADLSARTQILFFTHHAHLVALARGTLPESLLFVHHLPYPPAPVESPGPVLAPPRPKRRKKATTEEAGSSQ